MKGKGGVSAVGVGSTASAARVAGYAPYTQATSRKTVTKEEATEFCVERTVSVSESLRMYATLLKDASAPQDAAFLERKGELLQLLEGMKENIVHMSEKLKVCL